jgi:hypothetical protein
MVATLSGAFELSHVAEIAIAAETGLRYLYLVDADAEVTSVSMLEHVLERHPEVVVVVVGSVVNNVSAMILRLIEANAPVEFARYAQIVFAGFDLVSDTGKAAVAKEAAEFGVTFGEYYDELKEHISLYQHMVRYHFRATPEQSDALLEGKTIVFSGAQL